MAHNEFNYQILRKNLIKQQVEYEMIMYMKNKYAKCLPIVNYIEYLKSRIDTEEDAQSKFVTYYDKMGNRISRQKMNIGEHEKDLDVMVYNKTWNKLKLIHKTLKIKEYFTNLKYGNKAKSKDIKKNREKCMRMILNGIAEKKFSKNKNQIEYDMNNMVITSISCLSYNKKTGLYEIDFD